MDIRSLQMSMSNFYFISYSTFPVFGKLNGIDTMETTPEKVFFSIFFYIKRIDRIRDTNFIG
jgi:hypothetical protein